MLSTSPSQYQTFVKLCPRRWWLRHVHGLLEAERTPQMFGKALHSVVERYLKADATGRDRQTGEPVDPFPPGWEKPYALLPTESATLQRLVQMAIEKGVLYRPAGEYAIEREYFWELPGGVAREHGYADLMESDAIQDHKTHSASQWALSEAKLHGDWQMRAYAMELVRLHRAGGSEPPEAIRLRHNVYIWKKEERVFVREATVTLAELEEHQEKVLEVVGQMLTLSSKKAIEWESIPDSPRPGSDACNTYAPGGCPYKSVCLKYETPDQYKLRMANLAKTPQQLTQEAQAVRRPLTSLLGSPAAPAPAIPFTQAAAVVPPPPKEEPAPLVLEAAVVPSAPQHPPAPWYAQDCKACSGNAVGGFDSKGRPCRVCDAKAAAAGGRGSLGYQYGIGADGIPTWAPLAPVQANPGAPASSVQFVRLGYDGNVPRMVQRLEMRGEMAQVSVSQDEDPTEEQYGPEELEGSPLLVDHLPESHLSEGFQLGQLGQVVESSEEEQDDREETAEAEADAFKQTPAAEPPKRRGRPKGSTNKPKEMQVTKEVLGPPRVDPFLEDAPARAVGGGSPRTDRLLESLESIMSALAARLGRIEALLEPTAAPVAAAPAAAPAPAAEEGFTLAFGCRPRKGVVVDLAEFLRPLQEELAAHKGAPDFYTVSVFERRDLLAAAMPQAVRRLPPGAWLIVPEHFSTDTRELLDVLRSLASQVIQ